MTFLKSSILYLIQTGVGGPTAGVTGKGENWREKPPDAEFVVGAESSESAGIRPHLSGARGVGWILQDNFELWFMPVNSFSAIFSSSS
jgi:hypothetical protein